MSEIIHSRSIAEHLSTLASLLEAEALKAGALGMQVEKNLRSEAHRVRALADRLWQCNSLLDLPAEQGHRITPSAAVERRARSSQVKLVSG